MALPESEENIGATVRRIKEEFNDYVKERLIQFIDRVSCLVEMQEAYLRIVDIAKRSADDISSDKVLKSSVQYFTSITLVHRKSKIDKEMELLRQVETSELIGNQISSRYPWNDDCIERSHEYIWDTDITKKLQAMTVQRGKCVKKLDKIIFCKSDEDPDKAQPDPSSEAPPSPSPSSGEHPSPSSGEQPSPDEHPSSGRHPDPTSGGHSGPSSEGYFSQSSQALSGSGEDPEGRPGSRSEGRPGSRSEGRPGPSSSAHPGPSPVLQCQEDGQWVTYLPETIQVHSADLRTIDPTGLFFQDVLKEESSELPVEEHFARTLQIITGKAPEVEPEPQIEQQVEETLEESPPTKGKGKGKGKKSGSKSPKKSGKRSTRSPHVSPTKEGNLPKRSNKSK